MADKVKVVKDKGQIRILVYGTLKEGHGNHVLLKQAKATFVGYDSITGPFKMCDMHGFPGIYRHEDQTDENLQTIYGELYFMDPEGLAALDQLEGHPNFYRREKYWTNGASHGDQKRAWVYIINPSIVKNWQNITDEKSAIPECIWRPTDAEKTFWKNAA